MSAHNTSKSFFFIAWAMLAAPYALAQGTAVAAPSAPPATSAPRQAGAATTPASSLPANAQYVPTLTFDVASIRESKPDSQVGFFVGGGFSAHSSSLNLSNVRVYNLLSMAYGIDTYQMPDMPDWVNRMTFNVQAKSDQSVDEKLAKLDDKDARLEKEHMLQVLLAERLNLKVHWETKEGPVYDMVVAKGGSKLHAAGSMPPAADELKWLGGSDKKLPELHQQGDGRLGYEFIGHECPIQSLAEVLSGQIGTNVVDKTGLTGKYDFVLQYNGRTPSNNNANDPALWPPLTDAIPDQLGLNLKSAKGPIQRLVIDHIEKPSAN